LGRQGKYAEALELNGEALEIVESLPGKEREKEVEMMQILGGRLLEWRRLAGEGV
jgi:hypothetical protein